MIAGKHTPGPLEATGNLVRSSMAPADDRPRGICVAECADSHGQPHSDEAKANAKLFAAAPDVLAAAQAAWNCVIELPPSQARVELAQMLQAAIEKAGAQC